MKTADRRSFVGALLVLSAVAAEAARAERGRRRLCEYHALGNDYIVLDPQDWPEPPTPEQVVRICDRHRGAGADGVLYGPTTKAAPYGLRLFNPDGGEFEKSGNGLRIFARYLWDRRIPAGREFAISTPGGIAVARLLDESRSRIAMDLGQVSFDSRTIPVSGAPREVLDEEVEVGQERLRIYAATVGNPHCVVFLDGSNRALAERHGGLGRKLALAIGPDLERLSLFPNRTNVQFAQVVDRHTLQMEIWERGAGYTLASGTSSCAAAAAAIRSGRCESPVTVKMPGGELLVEIGADWSVRLTGSVEPVWEGTLLF